MDMDMDMYMYSTGGLDLPDSAAARN